MFLFFYFYFIFLCQKIFFQIFSLTASESSRFCRRAEIVETDRPFCGGQRRPTSASARNPVKHTASHFRSHANVTRIETWFFRPRYTGAEKGDRWHLWTVRSFIPYAVTRTPGRTFLRRFLRPHTVLPIFKRKQERCLRRGNDYIWIFIYLFNRIVIHIRRKYC